MIPLVYHPSYNITAFGLPPWSGRSRDSAGVIWGVNVFPFRPPHWFVSDDVEQVALVAQRLARHPDDEDTRVRTCRLPWSVELVTVHLCCRVAGIPYARYRWRFAHFMQTGNPELRGRSMCRFRPLAALLLLWLSGPVSANAVDQPQLAGVRRVVFLGDSITYSGQYIEYLEAYLRTKDPALRCEFLDLGLPSETVSGLSEPGHAGGKFPRPDLHERLDRVLEKARPDLVVACYGMNDGIYYPFSEERFQRFQDGMRFLRERATASGAKVLHVTPPVFDPLPIKTKTLPAGLAEYRQPYEGYDEVLDRYSEWLLAQRADGWDVVDVHGPMKRFLAKERERDPNFRLAGDGVHANGTGHWLITRQILLHWGVPPLDVTEAENGEKILAGHEHGLEVLKLIQRKERLLKDAWLTATGHERPGMKRGLPLEEADKQAAELEAESRKRLTPTP